LQQLSQSRTAPVREVQRARILSSVVTSNPANGGHLKTGQ
jgi:hypothetical protein